MFILANYRIVMLLMVIWFILVVYYIIILTLRLKVRITGYAIDMEGKLFKVKAIDNWQDSYFIGPSNGRLFGRKRNSGRIRGVIARLYSLSELAEYMSYPEVIAKIVEDYPNVTGAEVIEILKVYTIIDRKKSIKVKCDYKVLRNNKIKYNKNLVIEKSFNMFDDLINVLNTCK